MVPGGFGGADYPPPSSQTQCQVQQQYPDPHSEQGHIFKQDKEAIYK